MKKGKCFLVGAGPGDPGLLTLRGNEVLSRAEVVVYDNLANPELLGLAPETADLLYAGKKPDDHSMTQEEINRLLVEQTAAGRLVVRLKGGDPYVFGRGAEEAGALAAAGLDFEVVPGVSSALAGPAARRWAPWGAAALAVVSAVALIFAYTTHQRVRGLEAELVKRQADSGTQAAEARLLARQADQASRETAAKLALLEARLAETALQRTQIEELMQGLARSRDENVLADIDAALRVALQQSAITGSAEPLVATLRQADERLARFNQPRLERVRRAVAADLERVRSAGLTDFNGLAIRIDDLIRQVDELPMLAMPHQRGTPTALPTKSPTASAQSGYSRL